MTDQAWRTSLRAAVYRGDGAAVVALARVGAMHDDALQLIGGEEEEDESDDPDRWLWVNCEGSRDGYCDMELFIGTIADRDRADRLEIAIEGKGAFRRFKDVLAPCSDDVERW